MKLVMFIYTDFNPKAEKQDIPSLNDRPSGMPSVLKANVQTRILRPLSGWKGTSRSVSATMVRSDPFRPAKRVAGQKQDVW